MTTPSSYFAKPANFASRPSSSVLNCSRARKSDNAEADRISFWSNQLPHPALIPDPGNLSELQAKIPENTPHGEFNVDDGLLNRLSRPEGPTIAFALDLLGTDFIETGACTGRINVARWRAADANSAYEGATDAYRQTAALNDQTGIHVAQPLIRGVFADESGQPRCIAAEAGRREGLAGAASHGVRSGIVSA